MSSQTFLKGCGLDHCILQPQNERIWICLNGMLGREFGREDKSCWISRWWQLKDFLCSPQKMGEMIQFDSFFKGGWNLKRPTSDFPSSNFRWQASRCSFDGRLRVNQVAIWQGNQVVRQVVGVAGSNEGLVCKICIYVFTQRYTYIYYNVYLFNLVIPIFNSLMIKAS